MPDSPDQLDALRKLLRTIREHGNRFHAPRLEAANLDANLACLDDFFRGCPLTTKEELAADHEAHPPYGRNLTFPLDQYTRYCQTSGTTGRPMRWLDTNDSWQAMLDCWKRVYAAAGCAAGERVFFAFSFGPFLGFWTAFEAATQLHCLAIPGGGMSSAARLQAIFDNRVTTLCCTPTYAIHLAHAAEAHGHDLQQSAVARIIVAGEPGGSLPATRGLITRLWRGARVVDHHGLTEVGPVTFEDPDRPRCLRVMTDAYLHEVLNPQTLQPAAPGEEGELVLTTLKRTACPLLRYRTGDLVRADPNDAGLLVGGILGRLDDMVSVRGVNVYPAAVEQLVRQHAGVVEYQVTLDTSKPMAQLTLQVEPDEDTPSEALCRAIAATLRDALHLRVEVTPAKPGSLPRYELKAKRWKKI